MCMFSHRFPPLAAAGWDKRYCNYSHGEALSLSTFWLLWRILFIRGIENDGGEDDVDDDGGDGGDDGGDDVDDDGEEEVKEENADK